MTRIDFYVMPGSDPLARLQLICKLAEKASARQQRVFIHGQCMDELIELDRLLWDFRAMSFVAHSLLSEDHVHSSNDLEPVQLSTGEPGIDRTLLINLATEVPPFFSRFERNLEIVNENPAIQSAGRLRYRFYQQRGYPLQHHKM